MMIAVDNGPDRMVFAGPVCTPKAIATAGSCVGGRPPDLCGRGVVDGADASGPARGRRSVA